MRGDRQALYTCQNVVEEKMLPPDFLSVLKPPTLSADMALAKEHRGRESFSFPLHPHYILFLGHCQPIKQSFRQLDEKKGVEGKGADKEGQEQRNRNPFLLA